MRYGLPTLFRRVELALVQQTIEQTYKFTGSQRECSFMLMSSCFSIFLIMESFAFWTVINNTASSFYDVITQVTVAGFSHSFIFGSNSPESLSFHMIPQYLASAFAF